MTDTWLDKNGWRYTIKPGYVRIERPRLDDPELTASNIRAQFRLGGRKIEHHD